MSIELFAILAEAFAFLIISLIGYAMARDYRVKVAVGMAVKAAEQLIREPGSGELKKEWVINKISEQFPRVDRRYIEVAIESFVFELQTP